MNKPHAPACPAETLRGPVLACTGSDALCWAGLPDRVSAATDALRLPMRRVRADAALLREGQPFEALYLVASGSFKCEQTDVEGYEQVLGFALHGDMIGLDALGQRHHHVGAVALEDSTAVVLMFDDLRELAHRLPAMEALLHRAAGAEVLRRGDTQYLMAAPSSEVRVARFLLQFAQRQAALGHSGRRLRLCMTRRDIGSYLGVAHETVTRALAALVQEGCIRVSQRDIELVDGPALRELTRVTRGRIGRDRHADMARESAAVPHATPAPGPSVHEA